jgi:hypothetical protein
MAASIAESQQPAGSRHKPSDDGESGSNSSSNGHGADAVAVARTPRFGDGLTSLGELFADPKYLQPLLVGMSLMLFQQVSLAWMDIPVLQSLVQQLSCVQAVFRIQVSRWQGSSR